VDRDLSRSPIRWRHGAIAVRAQRYAGEQVKLCSQFDHDLGPGEALFRELMTGLRVDPGSLEQG
jgi:hypothetical protein